MVYDAPRSLIEGSYAKWVYAQLGSLLFGDTIVSYLYYAKRIECL